MEDVVSKFYREDNREARKVLAKLFPMIGKGEWPACRKIIHNTPVRYCTRPRHDDNIHIQHSADGTDILYIRDTPHPSWVSKKKS